MNPPSSDVPQNIRDFHLLYQQLTQSELTLDFCRIDMWRTFIGYRKPPFTHDDLRLVVKRLNHQIKFQKRNPGSLKFRNIIGNPDYFEEDLSEARAALRPRPPVEKEITYGTTRRIVANPGTGEATRSIADVIAAMREAAG